tara:strand:+ start:8068 stop:8187 length:120 start_codon:yes stop_codon:yes gene_type:complete
MITALFLIILSPIILFFSGILIYDYFKKVKKWKKNHPKN